MEKGKVSERKIERKVERVEKKLKFDKKKIASPKRMEWK